MGHRWVSRRIHFPDNVWDEIEAQPQPYRWAIQRAIFHLLGEPVPTLAEPFPSVDPLPNAYELHLPTDGVTIWYVIVKGEADDTISVQHVRADT
jgi:hypothetical protein